MIGAVPAKVPWLPSTVPPEVRPHRCDRCNKLALIPWTLRRDPYTKTVIRTWVCTDCQSTIELPEPD